MESDPPEFLGRGWSFPPAFDVDTGRVATVSHEAEIEQSLTILLSTATGERPMSQAYGCDMRDYLFSSINRTTKSLIEDRVRTAILYFEPRIDTQSVRIDDADERGGYLQIEVEYVVRTTNSRHNFVYPYYLREGTELPSNVATSEERG